MLASFLRDLKSGLRSLRATPLFTISTILVLAVGIGATTAAFSVVNGLLLRPLIQNATGPKITLNEPPKSRKS